MRLVYWLHRPSCLEACPFHLVSKLPHVMADERPEEIRRKAIYAKIGAASD